MEGQENEVLKEMDLFQEIRHGLEGAPYISSHLEWAWFTHALVQVRGMRGPSTPGEEPPYTSPQTSRPANIWMFCLSNGCLLTLRDFHGSNNSQGRFVGNFGTLRRKPGNQNR